MNFCSSTRALVFPPASRLIARAMPEPRDVSPPGDLPRPLRVGDGFRNPGRHEDHGLLQVLRWKLAGGAAPWPRSVPVGQCPPPPAPAAGVTVACVGHATFLIRTATASFLTDPVWSARIGPFGVLGPRRVQPPAIAFDALPPIDAVLLSHDHYDHCDLPTLRRLARSHPRARLFAPLGHGDIARRTGFGFGRYSELDWWASAEPAPGHALSATPARHWGNRLSGSRNQRLWCGWHLAVSGASVLFTGDTAFDENFFPAIRRRLGEPALALIPIGAYAPRWFMRGQHCDPAEAVRIHLALGARRSLGMHWGAFPFTDEPRDEPPALLASAAAAAGLVAGEFAPAVPGTPVHAPPFPSPAPG